MKKFFFILLSFILIFFQGNTYAEDLPMQHVNLGAKQQYGIKALNNPNASVSVIVSNAVRILFIIGGLASVVFMLWGAFDWIVSGGDKEAVGAARKKITNSLIGLALLALSAFIIALVGQIVGFNPLLTPPLPGLGDTPTAIQAPPAGTP